MKGRHRYPPLAGALATAALLAAGCGGDDSAPIVPVQTPTEPAALGKSDFIGQADAICGEANAAVASLDTGTTAGDPKLQVAQQLQITRSELESLQSLSAPGEDRATLDRFLSALRDEVNALGRKQDAVDQGGDTTSAESQVSSAEAAAQSAAGDYGFKDCAKASTASSAAAGTATTTTPVPTTATTTPAPTTPTAPAPAPAGGTAGGTGTGGGGTGTGGGTGGGGGSGGVSP